MPTMGRPSYCGGGLVVLTAEEKRDLERTGVVFAKVTKFTEHRYDCRVRCDREIEVRRVVEQHPDPKEPPNERHIAMGLCSSCSSLEEWLRRRRAETQPRGER